MVLKVLEKSCPDSSSYLYDTDECTTHYYDVLVASDSSLNYRFIMASKSIDYKTTEKITFWYAHFELPDHLINNLKINDFCDWLPLPLPVNILLSRHPKLEEWLEQKLLGENGWLCQSEYSKSEIERLSE